MSDYQVSPVTLFIFLSVTPLGWIFWYIFLSGIAEIIRAFNSKNK